MCSFQGLILTEFFSIEGEWARKQCFIRESSNLLMETDTVKN